MKDKVLPNFSLGWELEATERCGRALTGVEVDHDGSVNGEGLEYRTSKKIVFDPEKSLQALRHLATDPSIRTDQSCGFHVHIGLGKRSRHIHQWAAAFVTLARHIEKEAFEAVPSSRAASNFCRPWRHSRESIISQSYVRNKHACRDRYNWINPVEVFRPGGIRTIEVRLMGETHRYPYLLAWVAFCRLMAQSSWAVSLDISREQMEIDALKKVLVLIRDTFRNEGVDSRTVAKNSIYLAHRARLMHPYGNVLETLKFRESQVHMHATLMDEEAGEYRHTLDRMRQSIEETSGFNEALPVASEDEVRPGDSVECIEEPHDGNMTVGRWYRVRATRGQESHIQIVGDDGNGWWVQHHTYRLAERAGRVAISAV